MSGELNTIISFQVADEQFAFDALIVRHILELGKITRLPNVPKYIPGVINLHGNIIPVIDFRMIIGETNIIQTKDTSIIVISPTNQVESYLGLIVDMVNEVIPITTDQIQPSIIESNLGMLDNFEGTIHMNEKFIHLINIDALVNKIEFENNIRMSNETSTYLTFKVLDHLFGISVDKVMEISEYKTPRPIPESPSYILGVIEFREHVIPLIDMAQKFNMSAIEINPLSCMVVLELENIDLAKKFRVAVLVDAVSDVFEATSDEIVSLTDDFRPIYITASYKTKQGLVMILDADKVFSIKDVIALDKLIRS